MVFASNSSRFASLIERIWAALETETIDYGIMEKALDLDIAVVPAAGLKWSDVGSWDSLFDALILNKNGNIVLSGSHTELVSRSSMVYGNGDSGKLVGMIG